MATTAFKGEPVGTIGSFPTIGSTAPDFKLTGSDLKDVTLTGYKGKMVILNIFPSLDTSVCATSVRTFNKEAAGLKNTIILAISKDLPFAHKRFCSVEGIENVVSASEFKDDLFGKNYGVKMTSGPLEGLFARSVVVVDESGKVIYTELVPEITQEPDYKSALSAAK